MAIRGGPKEQRSVVPTQVAQQNGHSDPVEVKRRLAIAVSLRGRIKARFTDQETGENLIDDMRTAFGSILRDLSPREAKEEFEKLVRSRSRVLDAISVALDACYEDDAVKRAHLFRIAHLLFEQADQELLQSKAKVGTRVLYRRLIKRLSDGVDVELSEAELKVVKSVLDEQINGMTPEDHMKYLQSVDSPETMHFINGKIREKRIKSLRHIINSVGAGVTAAMIFGASFIDPGIAEALRAAAVPVAGASLHQGYTSRIEYIKLKAAVKFMEERFGIRKSELIGSRHYRSAYDASKA